MAKSTGLDDKTRAARALKRSGSTAEEIAAFELAVLKDVMAHSSISGNASHYVLERMADLEAS